MALDMSSKPKVLKKVCLLGQTGSGETSLINHLGNKDPNAAHKANAATFGSRVVDKDSHVLKLNIWDLGELNQQQGQVSDAFLKDTKQIVICFDSTASDALKQVQATITKYKSSIVDLPVIFIGCGFDDRQNEFDASAIKQLALSEFSKEVLVFLATPNKKLYNVYPDNSLSEVELAQVFESSFELPPDSAPLATSSYGANNRMQSQSSSSFWKTWCCLGGSDEAAEPLISHRASR